MAVAKVALRLLLLRIVILGGSSLFLLNPSIRWIPAGPCCSIGCAETQLKKFCDVRPKAPIQGNYGGLFAGQW